MKSLYEQGLTLKEISIQYNTDYDIVKNIFKQNNFVVKNRGGIKCKEKFQQDIINFVKSEEGKKFISEYQALGGTLKGLKRKYGLFPKTMKRALAYMGIPLKNNVQARREQAKLSCGKTHFRYGKTSPPGSGKCHWFLYDGISYQGSWEFKFGLWLKNKNIDFVCHKGIQVFPYTINGKQKTYCPDFFVPSWNKFIEIKGFLSNEDLLKLNTVKSTYSEYEFEIYDKTILIKNGVLDIDKKINFDIEKYIINYKTNETYFDHLIKNVDTNAIIDDWVLNKKSWTKIAKELRVPFIVLNKYMHNLVPIKWSDDYYNFLINRYLNMEDLKNKLISGQSRRSIAKDLKLFKFKTSYKLINKIHSDLQKVSI
jgi:hypothetical protein